MLTLPVTPKSVTGIYSMHSDIKHQIITGLERISEVFKSLLWEKAKIYGISPIQIQILLFIVNHKPELSNVSHLAKELNVTKPTISDAVRVLEKKGLVEKSYSRVDNRSYNLFATEAGKILANDLSNYAFPLEKELAHLDDHSLNELYATLTKLIYQLNKSGILKVQRTCFGCRFYNNIGGAHFCHLLNKNLVDYKIKIDCPEFEAKE